MGSIKDGIKNVLWSGGGWTGMDMSKMGCLKLLLYIILLFGGGIGLSILLDAL